MIKAPESVLCCASEDALLTSEYVNRGCRGLMVGLNFPKGHYRQVLSSGRRVAPRLSKGIALSRSYAKRRMGRTKGLLWSCAFKYTQEDIDDIEATFLKVVEAYHV